eukprot:m.358411 g.358411  ORF g.358411 m.358411 type:complete len:420 (-) comp18142_c0_seq1:2864-4123(-)
MYMTGVALCTVVVVLSQCIAVLAAPRYPFGSPPANQYAPNTIFPTAYSPKARKRQVKEFYDTRWKSKYLRRGVCGAGTAFTQVQDGGSMTFSEAHGYGMMITVFMAGYDADAHDVFNEMVHYWQAHPSQLNPKCMAWKQVNCKDVTDANSATDGDLDIAYAFLLASAQWGDDGVHNYKQHAQTAFECVLESIVDETQRILLLGDWGKIAGNYAYRHATRTSDFMPDHLRAFKKQLTGGSSTMSSVISHTYQVFSKVRQSKTGLVPDFIINADDLNVASKAYPYFLEAAYDGDYNYNACRVPLRLGIDCAFHSNTNPECLNILQKMNAFFRGKTGTRPKRIKAGYKMNRRGKVIGRYQSMAFTAPLGVSAMSDPDQQKWLDKLWYVLVDAPEFSFAYYEDTLQFLSMLVINGHWWTPALL